MVQGHKMVSFLTWEKILLDWVYVQIERFQWSALSMQNILMLKETCVFIHIRKFTNALEKSHETTKWPLAKLTCIDEIFTIIDEFE